MSPLEIRAPRGESVAFYMHDLSGGGVERMRLSLIEELRARGRHVVLVVQSDRGPLKALLPEGLPLVVLGASRSWSAIPALARFLRASRPDILVSSLDHNNIAALLAKLVSRTGIPVVICQHNALSAEQALGWRYRLVPVLYRLLHRVADAIIAVSDGVADDMATASGIARERITTIYNPVIARGFHERAALHGPHGWLRDRSCPVLVFAGRLSLQKDPQTLLRAFALLLEARPARLLILGEGPLRAELEIEADRLGIACALAFVGFQADPIPWIARASALVLSSRYEGLGNVIIEALACGTPVVSTDCPWGPAEILENGQFGILSPPGDALALSHAMRRCIESDWDPAMLRGRGDSFSAAACADRHLALFARLLGRCHSARRRQVFGLHLSTRSAAETVDTLFAAAPAGVSLVVTPNLDHLRRLRAPEFARAYRSSALCCPDGLPVLLYAKLRGLKLTTRVTGCEIFHLVATHPAIAAQRVFIVTESGETARAMAHWASQRGLSASVRAVEAPFGLLADPAAEAALAAVVGAYAPTILIMTLGAPTSEVFIHRNRDALPPCWALCLGQAVRVELGLVARAPAAWQTLGLEWLWRLRQEPRRLALRYAASLAWFPVAVCHDLLGSRAAGEAGSARDDSPGAQKISIAS